MLFRSILAIAYTFFHFVPSNSLWLRQIEIALVQTNLAMIVLNLLPIPPLDGAEAWAIFPAWLRRRRHTRGPPPPSRTRFDRERPYDAESEAERLLDDIRRDRMRRR